MPALSSAPAAARGMGSSRLPRYATYAWGVLAFNLLVILWGAFVRASGSGAGCGSHWPFCNGEVVPRAPSTATLIEFGHRVTSGLALLLVAGFVIGAWRVFPPGRLVRRAVAAGVFMVLEALIGAGLVLLELVAGNATIARAWWMAGHLVNTFLLVAALTLTAWWSTHEARPRLRGAGRRGHALIGLALAGMLVLGVSGAITALGDTLFPVTTLAEGEAMTFSGAAHAFVRLRVWHPALAVAVGSGWGWRPPSPCGARPAVRPLALAFVGVFAANLGLGSRTSGCLHRSPVQIAHLLLSDLVWIALVLLAARALATRPSAAARARDR